MRTQKFINVGLAYAKTAVEFSKDPSTQVGAAILRPDGSLVSAGWNGFAPNVKDTDIRLSNRETKYALTIHAELNAILSARESLAGYVMFTTPFPPCAHCASVIIKAQISEVYSTITSIPDRWVENFELAKQIFKEAGITYHIL